MQAAQARDGMFGIDTSLAAITAAEAKALAAAKYVTPDGVVHPIEFAYVYVPFSGQTGGGTPIDTVNALLGEGLLVGFVQHCRDKSWLASAQLGTADGLAAADFLAKLIVPPTVHVSPDIEDLANSGQPVFEHVDNWAVAAMTLGYPAMPYIGFDSGLTSTQWWDLPNVSRYWSDFGHRQVANRGCCVSQVTGTTRLHGVPFGVDIDRIAADLLGGLPTLVGA